MLKLKITNERLVFKLGIPNQIVFNATLQDSDGLEEGLDKKIFGK